MPGRIRRSPWRSRCGRLPRPAGAGGDCVGRGSSAHVGVCGADDGAGADERRAGPPERGDFTAARPASRRFGGQQGRFPARLRGLALTPASGLLAAGPAPDSSAASRSTSVPSAVRSSSRATRTRASSTSNRPCKLPRIRARHSDRICNAARIESSVQRSTMRFELRPLPRRDRQQHRLGADGQHHGVAHEVDDPRENLGRLNALAGTLLRAGEAPRRIVIGEGLEHRQQSLVARRPEQAVDDLDRQPRAAGGQQPVQQRLGVAQRAAGAAGDDLQGLGLGFDLLLLRRSRPASPRSPRA